MPEPLPASAPHREYDRNLAARPSHSSAKPPWAALHCQLSLLPRSLFASRHNGCLDFSAALHQLFKHSVQLVEVGMPGDKGFGLEASTRDQVQSLAANVRSVMKRRAQGNVAVVDQVGIKINVRAHRAP